LVEVHRLEIDVDAVGRARGRLRALGDLLDDEALGLEGVPQLAPAVVAAAGGKGGKTLWVVVVGRLRKDAALCDLPRSARCRASRLNYVARFPESCNPI